MSVQNYVSDCGTLFLGDCLEVIAGLPDDSCDLIFGSPPYEDARLYLEDGKDLGIARSPEDWVYWMIEVIKASLRVCRGLVAYVIGHGRGGPTDWTASPVLLMADLKRRGFRLRNPAIYKRDGVPGSGGSDWLKANYEWIVCVTKSKRLPWSNNTACGHAPIYDRGGECSHYTVTGERVNARRRRKSGTAGQGRNADGTKHVKKIGYTHPELANPGLIISCPSGGGKMGSELAHKGEAPFPEKLANFFIRSFCPPNGVVFDPFMGTGTTAAVAIKTGRRFLGCDLRLSQIKLSQLRIRQAELTKGFGL